MTSNDLPDEVEEAIDPDTEKRLLEIGARFERTPEFVALLTATNLAHKNWTSPNEEITIKVNPGLLPLITFLHERQAELEGKSPHSAAEELSRILDFDLNMRLHWAIRTPLEFPYYQNVWNKICDDIGYPEEKLPKSDPETPPDPDFPF